MLFGTVVVPLVGEAVGLDSWLHRVAMYVAMADVGMHWHCCCLWELCVHSSSLGPGQVGNELLHEVQSREIHYCPVGLSAVGCGCSPGAVLLVVGGRLV